MTCKNRGVNPREPNSHPGSHTNMAPKSSPGLSLKVESFFTSPLWFPVCVLVLTTIAWASLGWEQRTGWWIRCHDPPPNLMQLTFFTAGFFTANAKIHHNQTTNPGTVFSLPKFSDGRWRDLSNGTEMLLNHTDTSWRLPHVCAGLIIVFIIYIQSKIRLYSINSDIIWSRHKKVFTSNTWIGPLKRIHVLLFIQKCN